MAGTSDTSRNPVRENGYAAGVVLPPANGRRLSLRLRAQTLAGRPTVGPETVNEKGRGAKHAPMPRRADDAEGSAEMTGSKSDASTDVPPRALSLSVKAESWAESPPHRQISAERMSRAPASSPYFLRGCAEEKCLGHTPSRDFAGEIISKGPMPIRQFLRGSEPEKTPEGRPVGFQTVNKINRGTASDRRRGANDSHGPGPRRPSLRRGARKRHLVLATWPRNGE